MKEVLFIHHAVGWGGAPANMVEIIKSLDKNIYHAKVLLLKDSVVSSYLKDEGIEYSIATSPFYKYFYKYFGHTEPGYIKFYQVFSLFIKSVSWVLSRYFFAQRELTKHNYDIVHLNSSVLTDWLHPSKKNGKVIIHIQEPFRRGKFDVLNYFFRNQMRKNADWIIAISKDNADRIGLKYKTTIIYNFFDFSENEPSIQSYSSKLFLYLGGAAYIKGFYTLVKALDYLDKDVKIIFAGYYNSDNHSSNRIFRYIYNIVHLKNTTALLKMRNHPNAIEVGLINNVSEYLDKSCCLVSPFSKSHFSRPVVESHLHKKPVIGTDVQGMQEIIEHKVNGLIIPKNNHIALAEAINFFANNPQKAHLFGNNGYMSADSKFNKDNFKLFNNLYFDILNVNNCL